MKTVGVVVPTIAGPHIKQAIDSVYFQSYNKQEQNWSSVVPYIFVDGKIYEDEINDKCIYRNVCVIPENTGKTGGNFYGHRIIAASPHLLNTDYICLLDEDNWYKPDHVESLVNLCEKNNLDFAFSLRSIHSKDGEFVCDDECESLGMFPIWGNLSRGYLADTSSYCFRRSFFINCSYLWHSEWGGDRRFFNSIRTAIYEGRKVRYGCTGKPTLCYRLDGNEGSVTADFFRQGNKIMLHQCPSKPWEKELLND